MRHQRSHFLLRACGDNHFSRRAWPASSPRFPHRFLRRGSTRLSSLRSRQLEDVKYAVRKHSGIAPASSHENASGRASLIRRRPPLLRHNLRLEEGPWRDRLCSSRAHRMRLPTTSPAHSMPRIGETREAEDRVPAVARDRRDCCGGGERDANRRRSRAAAGSTSPMCSTLSSPGRSNTMAAYERVAGPAISVSFAPWKTQSSPVMV